MNGQIPSTQENILNAGKKEFLAKGFRCASLRNIVKEAGVTTGAFYGYYKSKKALFDALVQGHATVFLDQFNEAQNVFAKLTPEEQLAQMCKISSDCMDWMVGYIYKHFETFKLILCCSEGTEYEHFVHTMVEIEVNATDQFISILQSLGYEVGHLDAQLEHILASGLFSAFFETVIHDMPREKATAYVKELSTFYSAGWQKIMGL